MQLGLSVSGAFAAVLDDIRWAERNGLAAFAVPDHVLRAHAADPRLAATAAAPDPFVQLAALARETNRIELAILCSPVTFRHPAILLKSAIELSIVSGGRFTLGLGTGYRRVEHDVFGIPFPARGHRYELLADVLGYLRAGIGRPNRGFAGQHHRLAAHPVAPAPLNLRLLVGGGGAQRTPELAGRLADEYNVFATDHERTRAAIATARSAFTAAGRSGELAVSCAGTLVTGTAQSDVEREAARQAGIVGMSGLDYMVMHRESGSFLGTHADVAQRLHALSGLGVHRCYFVFEAPVDRAGVLAVRDALAAARRHEPATPLSPTAMSDPAGRREPQ